MVVPPLPCLESHVSRRRPLPDFALCTQTVVFDPKLIAGQARYHPSTALTSLLADLFDVLYCVHIHSQLDVGRGGAVPSGVAASADIRAYLIEATKQVALYTDTVNGASLKDAAVVAASESSQSPLDVASLTVSTALAANGADPNFLR